MDKVTIRGFRRVLRRVENLIAIRLKDDTCCHGVSYAQCHALLAVDELQEPSLVELAAYLGLDKSTLSRTVDGLVGIGLVVREPGDMDRRKMRVILTENGKSVCGRIHADNDAFYTAVLNDAEMEAEVIIKVFEGFAKSMSARMKENGAGIKKCMAKNQ